MLETKAVKYSYEGHREFKFPDFLMNDGDQLLILGRSGIGKTTFLHLIAGLIKPRSGKIFINDQEISSLSEKRMDHFRGTNIGLVFQQPRFIRSLSLLENIVLVHYLGSGIKKRQQALELLARLDLQQMANQKPHTLSRGEQQRAAIAMALINNPNLILADEPTASLDDENCEVVAGLLTSQAKTTNAKLLIITHDRRLRNLIDNYLEL